MASVFLLSLAFSVPFYLLCPVCGPAYAFPGFPALPAGPIVPHPILLDAPAKGVPSIHFSTALLVLWYGRKLPTGFIVDISETCEQKLEMLACHDSQRAWLRKQHGLDEYLDGCRRWSATRGAEIGVAYGEAFTQHRGHPYPHDNRLLELLGERGTKN